MEARPEDWTNQVSLHGTEASSASSYRKPLVQRRSARWEGAATGSRCKWKAPSAGLLARCRPALLGERTHPCRPVFTLKTNLSGPNHSLIPWGDFSRFTPVIQSRPSSQTFDIHWFILGCISSFFFLFLYCKPWAAFYEQDVMSFPLLLLQINSNIQLNWSTEAYKVIVWANKSHRMCNVIKMNTESTLNSAGEGWCICQLVGFSLLMTFMQHF